MQIATQKSTYPGTYLFKFYSLYIILLMAACSSFSKTLASQLVFIAFSIFLLSKKNKKWINDKFGFTFILSCLLVILIQYIITSIFMLGSVKFILILACVYFMIKEYGSYFTESLMQTMYRLVIITIPFYIVQIISAGLLKALLSPFNFSFVEQARSGGVYVFLFNLNPAALSRNSGFMWEPGAFGGILVFLIIYEYIKNNKQLNKKIIFLSIYALTTISTTTFLGLLLFVFLILFKRNKRNPLVLLISLILLSFLTVGMYNLPFMGKKIDSYLNDNLDYSSVDNNINGGYTSGTSIGRFSGMLIVLQRMPKSPIVGNGWDNDYSDLGISSEWSNPNGLASILGKFGIVGVFFLAYGLYAFVSYQKNGQFFENVILVVILLFPVFSNPFESNIVMWVLAMAGIYFQVSKQRDLRLLKYKTQLFQASLMR
jgi:hypothetical protein